jgi:hypothetical protein
MLLKSTLPMTRPMTGLMTSLTRLPTTPCERGSNDDSDGQIHDISG